MQILFLKGKKEKENMTAGGHLEALAQGASIRDKRKTTEGTFEMILKEIRTTPAKDDETLPSAQLSVTGYGREEFRWPRWNVKTQVPLTWLACHFVLLLLL